MTARLLPTVGSVFREQFLVTGLALRREGLVIAAIVAAITVFALALVFGERARLDVPTELSAILALGGFLAPFFVWRGEPVHGDAAMWSLPVEHRQHALLKVLAGGAWVLILAGLIVLWLVVLALISGSGATVETNLVRPGVDLTAVPPDALSTLRWSLRPWQWLAMLSAPAVTYLLGSAVVLAFKNSIRWIIVFFVAFALFSAISPEIFGESLLEKIMSGPVGLDYVLTGGMETLNTAITLTTGEKTVGWVATPTFAPWAVATSFWLLLGLHLIWFAAGRRREY